MTKKIVLVVLTIVLILIWWDNVKLFLGGSSDDGYHVAENKVYEIVSKKQQVDLTFKPPRINPFRKPNAPEHKNSQAQKKIVSTPVKVERPSSKHKLLGVLKNKVRPQIVMNTSNGMTSVLSIEDSLDNWILIKVDTSYAIFKNDKLYDTLWLENKTTLQ